MMVAQAFKNGTQMQDYLLVHNIDVKRVTRKRTGEFLAEFFHTQASGEPISMKHHVEAPTLYAQQITNALGGVRIIDMHETIAEWKEDKPRIDSTITFELIDTAFRVNQRVKLKGTSREAQISAVWQSRESSKTYYRLDVNAGAVKHQWVEEGRLEAVTILPVPSKWSAPAKVAEKRVSMLRGHTTLFPYGTFQVVK
jgi:hypothetical protein